MMEQHYIYICENSIEGLMTAIYESYYSDDEVYDIVIKGKYQSDFTYQYREILTDYDKAQKVAYAIKTKISRLAFKYIVNAWLSETLLCGHHILEYIKLGFRIGGEINNMLTQDHVAFIHRMDRKVAFENHRFLGILRFSKMQDGTYLSKIAPDHNIISLMAEHFASRMATEKLIIYDEKRKSAILSDRGDWIIVHDVDLNTMEYSEDEYIFREMWQRYFETIAIKERTNKKLQRSFIPVRYWKNVVELKDEYF